jgi:hypothetical protein
MNIPDLIDDARRAFEIGGRGCFVRLGEDGPRYAPVSEIAARLEPHPDATMLVTAVSEAVERYDPSREAAILLEVPSGYQVLILSLEGYDYVGGLTFEGYGLLAVPIYEQVEARAVGEAVLDRVRVEVVKSLPDVVSGNSLGNHPFFPPASPRSR